MDYLFLVSSNLYRTATFFISVYALDPFLKFTVH